MSKQKKLWNETTWEEITEDNLIEHAYSLGGKKTLAALKHLDKLQKEEVVFTKEMKDKKRIKLRNKKVTVKNPELEKIQKLCLKG